MHIAIIEMPAEGVFKVKVDENEVNGHIHRLAETGEAGFLQRWEVWLTEDKPLKTQPLSREAAAALIVYHHFETERRAIEKRRRAADS